MRLGIRRGRRSLVWAATLLWACKPTGSSTAPMTSTQTGASEPVAVPVVESEGEAPSSCRAFVNDEAGVHDVRVDATGKVTVARGGEQLMPFELGVSAIRVEHFGAHWAYGRLTVRTWFMADPEAEPGSADAVASWDPPLELVEAPMDAVPDPLEVLEECVLKLEPLEEDEHDAAGEAYDWMYCNEERYIDHRVEITAMLGPWLSHAQEGTASEEPYTEREWYAFETVDVNEEAEEIDADLLEGAALKALREDYFDSIWPTLFGEADEADVEWEEENFREEANAWEPEGFAFGFGPTSLWALAATEYESSYTNEQGYKLKGEVTPPHPTLKPHLPRDVSGQLGRSKARMGWTVPGCMTIEMADGAVHNKKGERTQLDLRGSILGVYFVSPTLDFSVRDLQPLAPRPLEGSFTLKDARAAVKAGQYAHAIGIFENLQRAHPKEGFNGELCWAYFLDGQLEQAEAACRDALLDSDDPRKLAAIAYNLGRISEAREDLPEADLYYTTSLELRPNKAVQERLDNLGLAPEPTQ